jgi:hypothetical protein
MDFLFLSDVYYLENHEFQIKQLEMQMMKLSANQRSSKIIGISTSFNVEEPNKIVVQNIYNRVYFTN